MIYIIDTNVVSELRKIQSKKADLNVERWFRNTPIESIFISAITIDELEQGVLLVERRDETQGNLLRKWLDESVSAVFYNKVLAIDEKVARVSARLHVPNPMPIRDAYIAATAITWNATLVTRNRKDFGNIPGLKIVDPWHTQVELK
jgi:predicted nucleic acid-binding protein